MVGALVRQLAAALRVPPFRPLAAGSSSGSTGSPATGSRREQSRSSASGLRHVQLTLVAGQPGLRAEQAVQPEVQVRVGPLPCPVLDTV
jgi:hypothetical protein